jgi:hypothetical protein
VTTTGGAELDDALIRADQIVGIHSHYTPALVGKPACWLLDVLLPTPLGNGRPDGRAISALHRTLIQTPQAPTDAPAALARLMAQLDAIHATGVITTTIATPEPPPATPSPCQTPPTHRPPPPPPCGSGSPLSPPSDSATTPDPNTSRGLHWPAGRLRVPVGWVPRWPLACAVYVVGWGSVAKVVWDRG